MGRDWTALPISKIKEKIGKWESSYFNNRQKEVVLARIRLNCVRCIHLIPRIEGTHPKKCNCTVPNVDLTLHHIFFDCQKYVVQRQPLINMLRKDNKLFSMKNLLEDDFSYADIVYDFVKNANLLDDI